MEKPIKVKAYYPGIAITEENEIFTWLPLPIRGTLGNANDSEREPYFFPRKIDFKIPDNVRVLGVVGEEMMFINNDNEISYVNFLTKVEVRERYRLPLQNQELVEIKVSENLKCFVVLTKSQSVFIFEYGYVTQGNEYVLKYYEKSDSPHYIKGHINAIGINNSVCAVVVDNKALILIGEVYSYSKHKRSLENKFTFKFKSPLLVKDIFLMSKKIVFQLDDENLVVNQSELDAQRSFEVDSYIDPKLFTKKLSELNSPQLYDSGIVISKEKVVYTLNNKKFNSIKLELNGQEEIIDVQSIRASYPYDYTTFILTSYGNLYGFGGNSKFELGIGSLDENVGEPQLINGYFNKEMTNTEHLDFILNGLKKNHSTILNFIPKSFKKNPEALFKILIQIDFKEGFHQDIDINFDILFDFIKNNPQYKYQVLRLYDYKLREERKLAQLYEYFPEIIFLFYDQDLSVEQFTMYLSPLLQKFKGKPVHANTINELAKNIFDKGLFTWDLEGSANFHLVLINFDFQYEFLSYAEVHKSFFNAWNKETREYFLNLPVRVKEKIYETCSIQELPKTSMNDMVESLAKYDCITLSERLIKGNCIPKSKFLENLKKNPELFSIRFKSFLLATPEVSKPKKTMGFNINDLVFIQSHEYTSYFFDKESLFVTGRSDLFYKNKKKLLRSPSIVNDVISEFSPNNIVVFSSYDDSFVLINDNKQIFAGGSLAQHIQNHILQKNKQFDENNPIIELTKDILVFKEEIIKSVVVNWYSCLLYTSQNRVIIGTNAKDIFGNKVENKKETFLFHDITSFLLNKNSETIKKIEMLENLLIYQTNQNNLFFYRDGSSRKINIEFSKGEVVEDFKVSALGLLVLTSHGRLLMTAITIENSIDICEWNRKDYTDENTFVYETDQFELDQIHFPFNDDEELMQWDINYSHAMVISSLGRVFLWGEHKSGALGSISFRFTNILNLGFLKENEKVINGFLGYKKTYLITNKNRLFAFGTNRNGSLGDGTEVDRNTPVDITNKFKR